MRVNVAQGYNVGLAEQLDAIEGLQRLTRDRGVEQQPHPDVERPHLGKYRPGWCIAVASTAIVVVYG